MMKYDHLKGKDLFNFLVENKKALINEKKSMPIKFSDPSISEIKFQAITKSGIAIKDGMQTTSEDPENSEVIRVTVVANSCNVMDSASDVLIPNSAKRSIQQRKSMMVHLSNHDYRIQAKVGEVVDVLLKNVSWQDLGYSAQGNTQCIIFVTDVYKSYDAAIFNQYKLVKINQHSIGLRYVDIELAINDPDYEKEIDFWNKYIDDVINKDEAIAQGYMWIVKEIQLLENSSVLFGCNQYTPTLNTSGKSHPTDDTLKDLDNDIENKEAPLNDVIDNDFSVSKLLSMF